MTALLGIAGRNFCFLAADTARFDLVQQRKLSSVKKLYASENLILGKAGAGSVVDKHLEAVFDGVRSSTDFASQWRAMAARDADIQDDQAAACLRNGLAFVPARYVLVAGILGRDVCRARAFPENSPRRPTHYGVFAAGTQEPELERDAVTAMTAMLSAGDGVNLASWAGDVIGSAEKRSHPHIGFPIDCALLLRVADAEPQLQCQRFADIPSSESDSDFLIPTTWVRKGR